MKTALVTGASRGIGRAIAIRLAKDGYRVVVHCAGNLGKAKEVAEKSCPKVDRHKLYSVICAILKI